MKLLSKLTAAALILALHAALLVVMLTLLPKKQPAATQVAKIFPTTVMVLLAPLRPQPVPQKQPALRPKVPPTNAAAQNHATPFAPTAMAPQLPSIGTATAITLPATPTEADTSAAPQASLTPLTPLSVDSRAMQSAVREADQHSVRRLALQSGKMDELQTAKAESIAIAAADSSEPPCPPAIQLRESVGDHGYRLTPDRSGDCARERADRVRKKALGR